MNICFSFTPFASTSIGKFLPSLKDKCKIKGDKTKLDNDLSIPELLSKSEDSASLLDKDIENIHNTSFTKYVFIEMFKL